MEFDYQELIESVQDLVFAVNRAGKLLYRNRQFDAFAGGGRRRLRGFPLLELVHGDDRRRVEQVLEETLKGSARTCEARFIAHDGSSCYFSTNLTPFFDDGAVAGAVGISRDINERIVLEQQITGLKNFQESILTSIQAGLITLDLQGRITSCNAGAEEVLNITAREALGLSLEQIVSSEAAAVLLQPAPRGEVPPTREMPLRTRAGHETYIGFTVTPLLDERGSRTGTILSFKDISQIKRMQAEVMRMDRLASLGVLASGIAHEIKNPLAGIKAMAQTLQEDMPAESDGYDYLERIVRQVNRLDALLKTFFDYARPRPPQRQLHRVQDILHEVMTLVDKRLQEHAILYTAEIPADAPPVFVDFHQIQQVLLNLIINAIDAMEEGGRLVIAARPASGSGLHYPAAEGTAPRRALELAISDTGIGIPEQSLEAIFDPFYTTKSQGTGLGLSIVYRIIAAHDGAITVTSRVGEGTTFRVVLPTEEVNR